MWAQLAMAGGKALQDQQNRKRDIESNVIDRKYSPWTGARSDFSNIGKNDGLETMMKGLGAGLMADSMAPKDVPVADAAKSAQDKADGDYYAKLSADPASVGVTPLKGNASSFSAIARAPAEVQAPVQQAPTELPSFMQGENPWLAMSKQAAPQQGMGLPSTWDTTPKPVDPTAVNRKNLWGMIPNNLPIKQGWGS